MVSVYLFFIRRLVSLKVKGCSYTWGNYKYILGDVICWRYVEPYYTNLFKLMTYFGIDLIFSVVILGNGKKIYHKIDIMLDFLHTFKKIERNITMWYFYINYIKTSCIICATLSCISVIHIHIHVCKMYVCVLLRFLVIQKKLLLLLCFWIFRLKIFSSCCSFKNRNFVLCFWLDSNIYSYKNIHKNL